MHNVVLLIKVVLAEVLAGRAREAFTLLTNPKQWNTELIHKLYYFKACQGQEKFNKIQVISRFYFIFGH